MRKADAICTAYTEKTKPARPRSYDALVRYVDATLPYYEAALRQLEALEPPAGDEATVRRWLAADRRVAKALRALRDGAQRRDFPSVNAAAADVLSHGNASRLAATALGLQVCGRVAPATGR